jgi:hypothetical protein
MAAGWYASSKRISTTAIAASGDRGEPRAREAAVEEALLHRHRGEPAGEEVEDDRVLDAEEERGGDQERERLAAREDREQRQREVEGPLVGERPVDGVDDVRVLHAVQVGGAHEPEREPGAQLLEERHQRLAQLEAAHHHHHKEDEGDGHEVHRHEPADARDVERARVDAVAGAQRLAPEEEARDHEEERHADLAHRRVHRREARVPAAVRVVAVGGDHVREEDADREEAAQAVDAIEAAAAQGGEVVAMPGVVARDGRAHRERQARDDERVPEAGEAHALRTFGCARRRPRRSGRPRG